MKKIRSKYSNPDFQFVRFSLAGLEFGFDVSSVKEIIKYKTPEQGNCPEFAEGVVKVRSMSVPLVDLRKRFGLSGTPAKSPMIIIASLNSLIAGLIVDAISDITLGAKEFTLRPDGEGRPWDHIVEARVEAETGPVLILSTSELLRPEEKSTLSGPLGLEESDRIKAELSLKKPGFMC